MGTILHIGYRFYMEYDWCKRIPCMNGYKQEWHKGIAEFTVVDVVCNMLYNPSSVWVHLHTDDELFSKRCGHSDFDAEEDMVLECMKTVKKQCEEEYLMLEERALYKIEQDYDDFRNEMLRLPQHELYEMAYKIFIITELYMTLTSEYKFTQKMLKTIVLFKDNILEQLYDEWLDTYYTHQEQLECLIRDSLKSSQQNVKRCA